MLLVVVCCCVVCGDVLGTMLGRLTMHLQDGGPKTHVEEHHGERLTRDLLTTDTTIISRQYDKRRLAIAETMHIRDTAPVINAHTKTLTTLPLFDRQLHMGH